MAQKIMKQNEKKIRFNTLNTVIILISVIIVGIELFYLFNLFPKEERSEKRERTLSINVLNLAGWTTKQELAQSILRQNNILTVNNAVESVSKGNFVYVNRVSAIPIIDNFTIDLKFFKKKGELVAIDLISANGLDNNNIYAGNEGLEISLSGENEIHITSFNNEKKIHEIYYIGKMPSTNFLRIEVVKNFISVKDRTGESIGTTFFTYNPFEEKEKMFVGVRLGQNSVMNISEFLIYSKEETLGN